MTKVVFKQLYNTILDGLLVKCKNGIRMPSIFTPEKNITLPINCFDRTSKNKIVLYRGVKATFLDSPEKSVAAISGKNLKKIYKSYAEEARLKLAANFSGLTQKGDPILHTSTNRSIAEAFAGQEGGYLIEYHMPIKYLRKNGIIGHLGESEIDFVYSVPAKFVANTRKIEKRVSIFDNNIPQEIHLNI